MRPTLSVLIVAWNSREELARTLPALLPELGEGDELIVVDNDSSDGTAEAVEGAGAAGAGACPHRRQPRLRGRLQRRRRRGERRAAGHPQPRRGAAARLRRGDPPALARGPRLGRLAGAGRRRGGDADQLRRQPDPLHRHRLGRRPRRADRRGAARPARSPSSPAPAWRSRCATWNEVGGFPERFFLYHEDVDLSLRLRLRGGTLGIEPAAVVDHDYEFGAREHKWRWLERNRLAFLVRAYPTPLLILLAPALLATELALLAVSASGGWGRQKLAANLEFLRWLPRLLRERRQVQATRTVSAAEFASWLTPDLDSPFISPAPPARCRCASLLRAYWRRSACCSVARAHRASPGGQIASDATRQIGWLVGRIRISLTSTPGPCSSA